MAISESLSLTSATNTTSTSSIFSLPLLTTTHIQYMINPKLYHTSFISWRAQFFSLLEALKIEGYVDGLHPYPPKSLPSTDEINPAFTTWKKQD